MRQGSQSQSALPAHGCPLTGSSLSTAAKGRCALPIVAPFASQWLVCWSGRWAAAAIAVVDVVLHVFVELLKKKCALETHLLNSAVQACDAQARAVIVLFDIGYAAAEVDTFPVVGAFNRGRKVFRGDGAGCWGKQLVDWPLGMWIATRLSAKGVHTWLRHLCASWCCVWICKGDY